MKLVRLSVLALLASSTLASACSSTLYDTRTIHNLDATRIWIIRRQDTGIYSHRDHVVFCDRDMAAANRPVCVEWPAAPTP